MNTPARTRAQAWEQISEASALRTLNSFAVHLIGIPSAEELFWYVAQNVVGRLNFIDCVIYQVNDEQSELRQVAAWGEKNPYGRNIINPLVIPLGRGITGQVAKTNKALIVDDLLQDQNYIPDTQIARSEICVPVVCQGRVVGIIDSEHPSPNAFGPAELEILNTVAAMTGAKLELLAETKRSAQRYQDLVASHAHLTQEITARKALELKLFEARRLEGLGRLTGKFAHEFNNILTVICGNIELLEGRSNSAEGAGFLEDAKVAAARGSRLIRGLLAFAQRARLDPVKMDINTVIVEFCAAYQTECSVMIETDLAHDIWPIGVDQAGIETLIHNLVENARDATLAGGKVRIVTQNVFHGYSGTLNSDVDLAPGNYVRITVSDTGPGIPESRLAQIFDPFFTTKPIGAGTGLGLAIVKGFAQQSGGVLTCTSQLGLGSSFQVDLPAVTDVESRSLAKRGVYEPFGG